MSPRHRFRVVLQVRRNLSREIDTESEDLAIAIARYLFLTTGDRWFMPSVEDIVGIAVSNDGEARA